MFGKEHKESPSPEVRHQGEAQARLVELCENLVMQGDMLAANDILQIEEWFRDHGASEIPALANLGALVQRITADREATPEEQEELFAAVEAAIAPEVRAAVKARQGH